LSTKSYDVSSERVLLFNCSISEFSDDNHAIHRRKVLFTLTCCILENENIIFLLFVDNIEKIANDDFITPEGRNKQYKNTQI